MSHSQVQQLLTDHIDLWTGSIENKSTAGRGSNRKQQLHGIKKLRELILELAVRGKLVPQDASDEPAAVLLERIAAERDRLVKEGRFKSAYVSPGAYTDNNMPFYAPEGWVWCELNDIAAIARGGSPRPIKAYITDSADGLNWIKIGDSERGSVFINKTEEKITRDGLKKTRMVYPGDLILSNSMSFGHPYILNIEGCIHDGWLLIRTPNEYVNKLFLHKLFCSPYAKTAFKASAAGAVVQNLNADKVRQLLVPLPPLPEQNRIIAKVDELMALCDQLELQTEQQLDAHQQLVTTLLNTLTQSQNTAELAANWARLSQHFSTLFTTDASIDLLKQTILQLAVMGKLVPQDPTDEPASELLSRIAAEKEQLIKAKKIKKQKPLPAISEEEKPFELPEGWEWCRIGNASLQTDYGLSEKTYSAPSGVPVLKMGDIQNGSVILGNQKVVSPTVEGLPDLFLEYGDILYNRTNSAELVGKTGIYRGNSDEYSFASYLIRIRTLKSGAIPDFINLNMNTPLFRLTQIIPHLKQQCGQANVNGTIMKNMLIAIAPTEEQHRIVTKVNELFALCDQLKQQLQQQQRTQLLLTDTLVQDALNR